MIDTLLAMNIWTIAAFMGAALVLYLTPGSDMMFTIASGASGGPKAGVAAAAGISFGVMSHCILAAAGLAALIAANPALLDVIRYVGAAYLVYIAIDAWRHANAPDERAGRADIWAAFRRGYLTNILNPKVGLFVLAFLPQFTSPEVGPIGHQILIFGVFLTIGGFVTDGLYGIFAGLMARHVRARAALMQKLSSLIFGGLAVRLVIN